MIPKTMAYFQLPQGTDGEEFWKNWVNSFAASHLDWPGIKKYEVSRLKRVMRGPQAKSIYGLAEFWWESQEAFEQDAADHSRSPERQRRTEEFESKVAWMVLANYEEKVVMDKGLDERKMGKRVAMFQIKKDVGRDAFYKHWFDEFAPTHDEKRWLLLTKYTLNKLVSVRYGPEDYIIDGFAELWFESGDALVTDDFLSKRDSVRSNATNNYERDWLIWMVGSWMEQKIIVDKTK